jgi:periplasmic divalent cation tolerance protein
MTTVPTRALARRIARELVRARLAACVQVWGPVESTYWWQGKQETGREWLCLVKTTRTRYNALVHRLGALHPYDTPEILALPVAAGSRKYLRWLASEVKGTAR